MTDVAVAPQASSTTPAVTDNSISQTTDTKEVPATPSPDEPWKKVKHKYKAMGEEHEVDYDELVKRAEKGHGSEKRLAEAARKEKEIESEKARLKKLRDPSDEDFTDLIELMGFDKAKKFADKLVWDQIQWDELPDHEKKRILAEQERDEAKSKLSKREEEDQRRQQEQLFVEADRVINQEITRVLADAKKQGLSVADMPEAKDLIIDEMLAYINYMDEMEAKGLPIQTPPPSHEDVLRKIQERYDTSSGAYVKRLSVEQLMKVLSKEQLSALRQAEIDQLYAPIPGLQGRSTKTQTDDIPTDRPSRKAERIMKTDDFFKRMDKRYGG